MWNPMCNVLIYDMNRKMLALHIWRSLQRLGTMANGNRIAIKKYVSNGKLCLLQNGGNTLHVHISFNFAEITFVSKIKA